MAGKSIGELKEVLSHRQWQIQTEASRTSKGYLLPSEIEHILEEVAVLFVDKNLVVALGEELIWLQSNAEIIQDMISRAKGEA